MELMVDPVFTTDGHVYEREGITKWFKKGRNTSPKTGKRLANKSLVRCVMAKQIIDELVSSGKVAEALCQVYMQRKANKTKINWERTFQGYEATTSQGRSVQNDRRSRPGSYLRGHVRTNRDANFDGQQVRDIFQNSNRVTRNSAPAQRNHAARSARPFWRARRDAPINPM
jgi:hypothetical protein